MFFSLEFFTESVSSPEAGKSPIIGNRNDSPASPNQPASPAANKMSPTSADWPAQSDEDIDRLVAMHQNRSSLSSLGVSLTALTLNIGYRYHKFANKLKFKLVSFICTSSFVPIQWQAFTPEQVKVVMVQ